MMDPINVKAHCAAKINKVVDVIERSFSLRISMLKLADTNESLSKQTFADPATTGNKQ